MKREFALAGIALVVSILLSSPTVAQTPQPQAAAAAAPGPIELVAPAQAEELSIDDAIMLARTQEERTAVLRRCSGPPPRLRAPVVTEAPGPRAYDFGRVIAFPRDRSSHLPQAW